MAKKKLSEAAPAPGPLAASLDRLAGELGLLRQVLDEIREDFSWVTRNGLPVQPVEHIILHQLPLDPCDPKWSEKVRVERFAVAPETPAPLDSKMLKRIVEDLEESFEAVAQGHLEVVLTALDGVRAEIIAAIGRKHAGKGGNPPATVSIGRTVPVAEPKADPPPSEPPREKPPRGHLF